MRQSRWTVSQSSSVAPVLGTLSFECVYLVQQEAQRVCDLPCECLHPTHAPDYHVPLCTGTLQTGPALRIRSGGLVLALRGRGLAWPVYLCLRFLAGKLAIDRSGYAYRATGRLYPTHLECQPEKQEQQQGKADTPGQPLDRPVALPFIPDKKPERRSQAVHDDQQEQND